MATCKKSVKKPAKAATNSRSAAKKTSKLAAAKEKTAKPSQKKAKKNTSAKKEIKPVAKKKPAVAKKSVQPKPTQKTTHPQPIADTIEEPKAQEKPKKGMDKYSIDVLEGPDNRYFVLTVNNYRNFFALEEMRSIVKACHQAAGEQEGMQRLYHWFKNFRQDVINNTKIEGPSDPALKTIYAYIVSTYTVKNS